MNASIDDFGNIIGRTQGAKDSIETVACGSHIDTVPNGGPLDGSYGVLAAIEAARTLHEHRATGKRALQVIVFAEEEGIRFGPFIGSKGFTQQLSKNTAYALKDHDGISYQKAFTKANLTLDAPRYFTASLAGNIKSYIELHIEQGPILEHQHKSIGVVESIVGLGDLVIELRGKAGHAGTTPIHLRRDALLGAARVVTGVREIADKSSGNAVATVGAMTVEPGVANVIPGKVTITVDYRHTSVRGMQLLKKKIDSLAKLVGRQENLHVTCRLKSYTKPTRMSPRILKTIQTSAASLGLSCKPMQSGAGHDCQNMARLTETGMIFVPSHNGLSHSPAEYTKPKQLEAGANVLLLTLQRLCNS